MRDPGKTVRADYNQPEFRRLWHDPSVTLEAIAQRYGVSIVSIWKAASRRDFPGRFQIRAENESVLRRS